MISNGDKKILKAIVLDFDGVIAESLDVKAHIFAELFKEHRKYVDEIMAYHLANGGVPREQKIRHIHENILGIPADAKRQRHLAEIFSGLALTRIVDCPCVAGAEEFIAKYSKRLLLYIVSGTPEIEMRLIAEKRNIARYFRGIFGSPSRKAAHNQRILSENGLMGNEVLFVGDALEDYHGAKAAGMMFVGRVNSDRADLFAGLPVDGIVNDLSDLDSFCEGKFVCGDVRI